MLGRTTKLAYLLSAIHLWVLHVSWFIGIRSARKVKRWRSKCWQRYKTLLDLSSRAEKEPDRGGKVQTKSVNKNLCFGRSQQHKPEHKNS